MSNGHIDFHSSGWVDRFSFFPYLIYVCHILRFLSLDGSYGCSSFAQIKVVAMYGKTPQGRYFQALTFEGF